MSREPSPVAVLAARLQRAWPSLSCYSCAALADELHRIERAQRRHAERCCSGEDGGYVRPKKGPAPDGCQPRCWVDHDPEAENRAGERIARRLASWHRRIEELAGRRVGAGKTGGHLVERPESELCGDPRGAVLLLRLPGEPDLTTV